MKNLILKFTFLLFAGTICSFQTPQPTLQEVFQSALEVKALEKHLDKNNEGELLPLILISNDYIATEISLKHSGNKVSIYPDKANLPFQHLSVLELTEIKMNDKKSKLVFKYGDKSFKIRLKKEGNRWIAKTVSIKWKNRIDTQFI